MRTLVTARTIGILTLVLVTVVVPGCGNGVSELEKARQAEAEARKRLQECQTELERTRKALEAAKRSTPGAGSPAEDVAANARWKAARMAAETFLDAVNSRNATAIKDAGTKAFREGGGSEQALKAFTGGRFRGEADGYRCAVLTSFEAVPGQDEFVGRGSLLYRGVPRQDSTYTVRVVKEGDRWRIAAFSAAER